MRAPARPVARASRALTATGLATALLLSGCGGGDPDPPEEPPAQLLREAAQHPASSGEAGIELDLRLDGSSLLAGDSAVSLDGPFELAGGGSLPRFDFSLDADVAGFGVDGALVSTGSDAFVVFFGENYRVGAGQLAALESRLAGGLGLDPSAWIEQPRYAGSEEVAGTETERIEGTLRPQAIGRDLAGITSALGAPALAEAIAAGAGSGPAEAWVAYDDRTIRRLRVQFPFTVPARLRPLARGIESGAVSLDAEIADVGAEVAIEPPPGGGFQPLGQLLGRLRDLASLGGL